MTDQPTNPTPAGEGDAAPAPSMPAPATSPPAPSTATPSGTPAPATFEQRMDDFGRRAGATGERLGREAEAAADRWSKDPALNAAGDTLARVWGLLVLAVGLWFFADVTLGLDVPAIAWRELWPIALIVLGLAVLFRAMAGRRA